MTAEEIIALGEAKPQTSTPVEKTTTEVEVKPKESKPKPAAQPFPDDWPEPAVKRINQLHGQKIGLHTQLEQERNARLAAEKRAQDAEMGRRKAEAELPVYQKMAIEQGQERYKGVNDTARQELANVFRTGNITPESLGVPIQNIVAAELSKIELNRAKQQIQEPSAATTEAPPVPQNEFQRLKALGRTVGEESDFQRAIAGFAGKHGIDWNAQEGTPEAVKRNAALQLDKSAVQRGYPVNSYDYWQHMEDGLRRAVPEDRSASGTEHTETVNEPVARKPVPSVSAPAARTNSLNTGGSRQKISMSAEERQVMERFLVRNPKVPEADYLREWQKLKELER